ncbi:MAG: hypothetical protein U0984_08080 [Prosthecobacter sp.]|nr:hypothetical protein [Prosthecobacter sp.]
MNLLYPRLTWRLFGWLFVFGLVGSCIAGAYGVLHDQVTFGIGPEYFTRLKFQQFHYLSRDQPVRLLVGEIGFLATWWVGFFAAWFMGRVILPHESVPVSARRCLKGVLLMMGLALAFAVAAYLLAPTQQDDPRLPYWEPLLSEHGISDSLRFVRVAYIHNASYLGGLIGLIASLIWLRWTRKQQQLTPQ